MDFGIARALHGASSTMTQTGMVMGTPQYLSPEQALGKAVDHRSDLYATGCLLYELLALRPAVHRRDPAVGGLPARPGRCRCPRPRSPTRCRRSWTAWCMRSLAKDPDDRFQSAEEMRGLVQYGLQMLHEQGGHTGTWNTGPSPCTTAGTPRRRACAGTSALPHPGDAADLAVPQPILPSRYGGGDDGRLRGRTATGAAVPRQAVDPRGPRGDRHRAGVALALQQRHRRASRTPAPARRRPTSTTSRRQAEPTRRRRRAERRAHRHDHGRRHRHGRRPDYTPSYTPSTRRRSRATGPTPSDGRPRRPRPDASRRPHRPPTDGRADGPER